MNRNPIARYSFQACAAGAGPSGSDMERHGNLFMFLSVASLAILLGASSPLPNDAQIRQGEPDRELDNC
jgi:hypothetical protein